MGRLTDPDWKWLHSQQSEDWKEGAATDDAIRKYRFQWPGKARFSSKDADALFLLDSVVRAPEVVTMTLDKSLDNDEWFTVRIEHPDWIQEASAHSLSLAICRALLQFIPDESEAAK